MWKSLKSAFGFENLEVRSLSQIISKRWLVHVCAWLILQVTENGDQAEEKAPVNEQEVLSREISRA
jgi:hypothetical protein